MNSTQTTHTTLTLRRAAGALVSSAMRGLGAASAASAASKTSKALVASAMRGGATSKALVASAMRGGATSKALVASAMRGLVLAGLGTMLLSCTSVLVQTTGPQGIEEDRTRRSLGVRLDDESIETSISVNLRARQPQFEQAHVKVVSHNKVVLLVGQVPTAALKDEATTIALASSSKIKQIHNWLETGNNTTQVTRANDDWINVLVRRRFATNRDVPGQVRPITENGTVYLLGIVSEAQGEHAARAAQDVNGVKKVVKAFEYIVYE